MDPSGAKGCGTLKNHCLPLPLPVFFCYRKPTAHVYLRSNSRIGDDSPVIVTGGNAELLGWLWYPKRGPPWSACRRVSQQVLQQTRGRKPAPPPRFGPSREDGLPFSSLGLMPVCIQLAANRPSCGKR